MRLTDLAPRTPAFIAAIDWAMLGERDARRLRELGVDEGVAVELLHRAPFGADPIAVRVGRMTVALRRATAAAITTADDTAPVVAAA